MHVSHVLITLICFASSSWLADADEDCGPHHYYDPVTAFCQPCSDCSNSRTGNVYCENKCKGEAVYTEYGVILVNAQLEWHCTHKHQAGDCELVFNHPSRLNQAAHPSNS